jgi:hypothetical protein
MRAQGVDTRKMGSNEHNMGRAVHNVHVYLQGLRGLHRAPEARQTTLGL